jgi:MtrB/PioB family decaheme-associated outer membrane protein
MKISNQLLLLSMLSALSGIAGAADSGTGKPDTSKWECKDCAFEQGWSGSVDAGLGHVSDKSYKFGEYTGLNKQGGFFIGDGSVRFRGADAYYWNINASNLGLDSRSLDAEGGRQGKYKLILKYDELPHTLSDSARTPFVGNGGASLTLPAGFPAAITGAMPLAGTLQQVDLSTQRKRLAVGGSWIGASDWEYAVKFSHETKDGMKRSAGAFFTNSAQLVEPVDYVTDQVDASASYTGSRLQAKLAYYGSRFSNSNDALMWQNPFAVPATPGALAGQLALPPDNQFHQFLASAGYQFNDRTRGSADIAWGRVAQNQGFLASTLNAGLVVPGLPGSSLNGRAATLDANLKLTSAVTDRLRLNAIYTHNDRDNQTPQASYPSVSTDMFLGTPRTNLPYSFKQDKLKLSADYRFTPLTKAAVGFDHDRRQRTFQEVDATNEDTFWGKITTRALDKVDMTLKLAHGERKGSAYQAAPGILPPENPLLRKYSMANRDRDSAVLRIDIAATDTINVGLGAESSKDDYSDSAVGLTSGRDLGLNADVSWIVTEQTSLHLFGNRQEIKSTQRGSQTYSTPDWSGENKDRIDTIGIGVKHAAIKDKLDIGADYTVSRARSDISVNTGASNPAFPNLSTSLDSLKLYAMYRLKDSLSLLGSYWHEHYDTRNWMLDGVTPSTIANVLTFGEQPPRYNVNVVRLAVRYRF